MLFGYIVCCRSFEIIKITSTATETTGMPNSNIVAAEYKKQTLKRKEEDSSKPVFYNFEATLKISVQVF